MKYATICHSERSPQGEAKNLDEAGILPLPFRSAQGQGQDDKQTFRNSP